MRRTLTVAATAAMLLTTVAGPSAAATSDDGLWYYTATGLDAIHQRTTGEGITIAVLDDPVNPDAPDLLGTSVQVKQPSYCATETQGPAVPAPTSGPLSRHGTHMAAMLVGTGAGLDGEPGVRGIAPGTTVISYTIRSVSDSVSCLNPAGVASDDQAFRDAIADGADIINVSGALSTLSEEAFSEAIRAGVIVVGAAGNNGGRVVGAPAEFNGAVAVGTVTADRTLDEGSPSGPEMGVVAPGTDIRCMDETFTIYGRCTGSSDAAVYTSGVLALLWSLHPDATANQVLQALVHTTDGELRDEPVHDDAWGYGTVNARLLVDADPSSYPDVSPFIREDPDATPPASALTSAAEAPAEEDTGTAPVEPPTTTAPAEEPTGTAWPVVVGAGGVAALVIAGVVTAVVLNRRRRDRASSHPQPHEPSYSNQHGGHHG
ncbi:S8 family peptidase [Cellulomonas triticagri]|uniref:Peptidase S8/S53 domain-containing protein n=1 Tax=Cellulomonas triticagri TaxID=2483352 RepID=A0A3M2IXN7_9CELL|nr:S8 family serine peptidase [Cellulomonas triticagri]RMI03575.1 hypothetical protein EBM89_19130 [Cellulomonas triticagri]